MRERLSGLCLWLSLTALWLALNQSLWAGDVLLGALIALVACRAYRRLQPPADPVPAQAAAWRRGRTAFRLLLEVAIDVVRSNIAVARIILFRGTRNQTAGFLDIPLQLRDPAGLATLACIITATPGTAWGRYDAGRGILTIHVLDLVDRSAWTRIIKDRYERRLQEIFE